jgi:BMFP domain-containing protein YqiC
MTDAAEGAAMQNDNRFFDDLSRVAGGAFSAISGLRDEFEAHMREQFERLIGRLDLVKREEFEVVKEMASRARLEQEALAARVAALEARLAATAAPKTSKPRPAKA